MPPDPEPTETEPTEAPTPATEPPPPPDDPFSYAYRGRQLTKDQVDYAMQIADQAINQAYAEREAEKAGNTVPETAPTETTPEVAPDAAPEDPRLGQIQTTMEKISTWQQSHDQNERTSAITREVDDAVEENELYKGLNDPGDKEYWVENVMAKMFSNPSMTSAQATESVAKRLGDFAAKERQDYVRGKIAAGKQQADQPGGGTPKEEEQLTGKALDDGTVRRRALAQAKQELGIA